MTHPEKNYYAMHAVYNPKNGIIRINKIWLLITMPGQGTIFVVIIHNL
jgi:hypothetical protein